MGFAVNYLRNLAAVAVGRRPTRPLIFSYYITHRCNLNCGYCSDGKGRPFKEDRVEELTTAQAGTLLTLLRRAGDTLDITGGEPLLRTDLAVVLEQARKLGFRTILNTKGLGLSDRAELLQFVDVLVLSVDSLRPDRLKALLGGSEAAARGVLQTLAWLTEDRPRCPSRFVLACVATPEHLPEVREVLHFARRHRLGFQISPQIVGTTIHPGLRDEPRYRELLDEVLAAKQAGAAVMGVPAYLRGIREVAPFTCHPQLMPTIRPDGTLYYPCLEKGVTRVSILEAGGYAEAWQSARTQCPAPSACRDECHLFCHMALSLLQGHPWSALKELRTLGGLQC